MQKWKVGWNNHIQYHSWHSKAIHIDSALINAFLETGEFSDTPFNFMEWNRYNHIWCGFKGVESFFYDISRYFMISKLESHDWHQELSKCLPGSVRIIMTMLYLTPTKFSLVLCLLPPGSGMVPVAIKFRTNCYCVHVCSGIKDAWG